jgi:acetyl-CoA synthetase
MAEGLSATLEELQRIERFDPPEGFRERALVADRSEHDRAAADPRRLVGRAGPRAALERALGPGPRRVRPAVLQVVHRRQAQRVLQLRRPPRRGGNGETVAFHWHGEEGETRTVTYADLHRDVQRFANALKDRGIGRGDVVGIFLPMIPEVVVAMLACARIGAPHNVVFGGFSPHSVASAWSSPTPRRSSPSTARGARARPRRSSSRSTRSWADLASIETIFVVRATGVDAPMQGGRDVWFHEICEQADPDCPAEPMEAENPLFILYTSGSTAKPKGILHTTGGYLTGVAWTTRNVFDLKSDDDVFWCSADVGWITGHSYIVYGPLLNGVTSVMYEGAPDYPDKDIWWSLIAKYGVTVFYTAPTAIRSCIKWGEEYPSATTSRRCGCSGRSASRSTRRRGCGTARSSAAERRRSSTRGGRPRPATSWSRRCRAPRRPSRASRDARCRASTPLSSTSRATRSAPTSRGILVLRRPWPGMLRTLYREEDRFIKTYFSRLGKETYVVGDAARRDADGYISIVGRIDDVINVSGHRMSTAEIESAIVSHVDVAEAAVIGQADEDTGQAIAAFVTLQGDLDGDDAKVQELRDHVAERIGKLARPKRILWADDLPKTRSGKIMRRLLRDIAEGRELGDVTTLRDPAVMEQLQGKIAERQKAEE